MNFKQKMHEITNNTNKNFKKKDKKIIIDEMLKRKKEACKIEIK